MVINMVDNNDNKLFVDTESIIDTESVIDTSSIIDTDSMNEDVPCNTKCQDVPTCRTALSNPFLAEELRKHFCKNVMVVLKANQLNILNQVFRPIMVGKLVEVTDEFAMFETVNIKMNQAPEFVFPTPLMIPLNQIAWYMPFDPSVRISLY